MEGKLIKQEDGYYALYNAEGIFIRDVNGGSVANRLSLKNCQAIANGYDLDELFDEVDESIDYQEFDFSSFKLGFKKALEILGDKKFSEDDLREAISQTRKGMLYNKQYEDEHIQSLQQTEWDVEIKTEKVIDETKIVGAIKGVKGSGNKITTYKSVPKLDEDGCLILRRC